MHLTPEELIDLAEDARPEASTLHLADCALCRDQLAATRTAMAAAADVEVPEPSLLFWTTLSTRVNAAIDDEQAADRRWWLAWTRPRIFVPLSAAALVVIVVALVALPPLPKLEPGVRPHVPAAVLPADGSTADSAAEVESASDPFLTLVSDLSANLDLDDVSTGFASRDSAEHAVTHMNTDELRALKQLLQAELRQGD